MAEETEGQDTGAEPVVGSADPAAVALALAGASRTRADEFLGEQIALTRLQKERLAAQDTHFHEEAELELAHLRWRAFSDRMKGALQIMTVLLGLAVVGAVGIAAWNAAHADGLVVEALSVPPRYAETGISGAVVADDLMNHVGAIRDLTAHGLTNSKGVSRDHDDDIKVEIPETGVSLGQVSHYLRLWLGHERRVTGNLRTAGDGTIALTVVLEGDDAFTVSGGPGQLDKLEQQAAEHVFGKVDPINFALYLLLSGRNAEAGAAAERAVQSAATSLEQADAYSLFSFETKLTTGDMALAAARDSLAISINPKAAAPHVEVMRDFILLGHDEEGLAEARALQKIREEDQMPAQRGSGFQDILYEAARERALATGDFADALSGKCILGCSLADQSLLNAEYAARLHDVAQSSGLIANAQAAGAAMATVTVVRMDRARYFRDAAAQDWRAAAADARAYAAALKADTQASPKFTALAAQTYATPLLAIALAEGGDFAGAEAAIGPTPGDCYDCVRVRGLVAAADKQWGRADYWFARAAHDGPSIPFAYADWGQALLARGDPDAAITQFTIANQKGPHFADPLEVWGEALMAKNQSHLALAKFAEADKYAPNWGRLHLKWGEALGYAGKPDEAKKQFARAASLDLTPSEKSELARHL
ncbi:MAG TPA: hypothetical protein VMO78_12405 [Rhizomicrobium sp.]|nr:hypothetical protein [Rhizomicrobium sp.]